MTQFILEPLDEDPFAKPPVAPAQAKPVVTLPGGWTYEHLDKDPFRADIDFSQPKEKVRAEIAKLAPGSEKRKQALADWADYAVARDRKKADEDTYELYSPTSGTVEKHPYPLPKAKERARQIVRGTPVVGPFMPEISAHINELAHKASGGKAGMPYEEALAYEDALNRTLDTESPKEALALKLAGGIASGGPVAKALLSRAEGMLAKSATGAGLGYGYGYTSGFGESRADTAGGRHEAGLEHGPTAALIGGLLPPGVALAAYGGSKVADKITPQLARAMAAAKAKFGIYASADDISGTATPGAWAAALQMAANQLRRAGRTEADIEAQIAKMNEARTLFSSGKAQDVHAIVDLDPSLAELVAYAARQDPGARNWANTFFRERQTGHRQPGHDPAMGLPTRERMGPKLTAAQAERQLGTKFGAGSDENMLSMGQGERIVEYVRRLFQLQDRRHHGHQQTAEQTDQVMRAEQKATAREKYGLVREAGQGVDIADPKHYAEMLKKRGRAPATPENETFAEAVERWANIIKDENPMTALPERLRSVLAKEIAPFIRQGRAIGNIEVYDDTKQFLDQVIKAYGRPGSGVPTNTKIAGKLREMLNDFNNAVDRVETNFLGPRYNEARDLFQSVARLREDIKHGRALFDPSTRAAALERWRKLDSDERKKLMRFGFLDELRMRIGEKGHNHDKTVILDKANLDDLVRELSPVTTTPTGRTPTVTREGRRVPREDGLTQTPERFGRLLDLERRMGRETPQTILGGSPTQKNAAVDEQFNLMSHFEEAHALWRSSGSLTQMGLEFLRGVFSKLFGMRADTSKAIARQLLTADPVRRRMILQAIYARMGPDRFDQFMAALERHQQQLTATAARQTQPEAPTPQ